VGPIVSPDVFEKQLGPEIEHRIFLSVKFLTIAAVLHRFPFHSTDILELSPSSSLKPLSSVCSIMLFTPFTIPYVLPFACTAA